MSSHYGTLVDANLFFGKRLYTTAWDKANGARRTAALNEATELVDQFDFIGEKYAVQVTLDAQADTYDWTTDAACLALRTAEVSQPLEFPRGDSNVVPTEIEYATYLVAKELLAGRSVEKDLENLALKSAAIGGVKDSYQRDGNLVEHLTHLIPSPEAWALIKPFLRERDTFTIKRTS